MHWKRGCCTVVAAGVACFLLPALDAEGLVPHRIMGASPVADGTATGTEWPWAPQIEITEATAPDPTYSRYVKPTYVTFAEDGTDLFVLVDAVGDRTVGNPGEPDYDNPDECLLMFGVGVDDVPAEICVPAGTVTEVATPPILGGTIASGFGSTAADGTAHRFYEYRIPLTALGVGPGMSVAFCAPLTKTCLGALVASMPYDGSTGHDNIWPLDLDPGDRSTWIDLDFQRAAIPVLTGSGVLLLVTLLALAGAAVLRRGI